jgi:hypothetical protein
LVFAEEGPPHKPTADRSCYHGAQDIAYQLKRQPIEPADPIKRHHVIEVQSRAVQLASKAGLQRSQLLGIRIQTHRAPVVLHLRATQMRHCFLAIETIEF